MPYSGASRTAEKSLAIISVSCCSHGMKPSLYGTLLETQQAGELPVTILPVEQVLPFFAAPNFMDIVSWEMGTESRTNNAACSASSL